MYIPMGGAKWKIYNTWVIFIFVALWHDLNTYMLIFGIGCGVLTAIEITLMGFINRKFRR